MVHTSMKWRALADLWRSRAQGEESEKGRRNRLADSTKQRAPAMSGSSKIATGRTIVVKSISNGKSFGQYTLPGGTTVRVMNAKVLEQAIRKSDQPIRSTVERIRQRRGAAAVNE